MGDAFRPLELLDTARALHGTHSLAKLPSARRIAEIVAYDHARIMDDVRAAAVRFDAATFLAPPSSSIASPEVADQWIGVTLPVEDISRVPPAVRLPAPTAVFFLWLSLLTDVASGSKSPEELRAKDDALRFWLEWEGISVHPNLALPFSFSPRDKALPVDEFVWFSHIVA